MILYLEDFARYPTAAPDFNSLNTSWVDQAYKYKSMGVLNWYFMLTLYSPALAGISIYSEDLTAEQKRLILLECEHNPWFVLREVMRVPANSGGGHGPLKANRGNIAMFWCVFNSFITYMQQIRQTGKSLNTRALVVAWHLFWAYGSTHILFTKGDLRKEEIKEYKRMRAILPQWMWSLTSKDTDNQNEFTNYANENKTKTYIPQGDPEAANGVGRGTTPTLVNVDEPPFLPYAAISIPSLSAATTTSFDEAKAKGKIHAILFTTTAGDLSTDSGRFVYDEIKKKAMFFSEMLFDCKDRKDAIATILANSSSKVVPRVDISFNHLQLGYSDEWLKEKIASVGGSLDGIKRDYLGQWTYGSASNPIPEKLLNKIREYINHDLTTRIDPQYKYAIRYHVPYEEAVARKCIVGLDTSNAVGRDAITGVAVDIETTETLFSFSINETFLEHFGDWLVELFVEFPNMTLIPENKSSWAGIGDKLLIKLPARGVDPGRRIYSRLVDRAEESDRDKRDYREYCAGVPSERKYAPYRSRFGFSTDGDLRTSLYTDVLRAATAQSATLIRDPVLIDELSSLVTRNDRIDHKASGHDDHVISWLMANWFLRYARNLDHYGIDVRRVLSRLKISSNGNDPKEVSRNLKEERLRMQIEELEYKLEKARTPMESQYFTTRLKSLKSELKSREDEQDVGSIDRLSADAKIQRTETARIRHGNQIMTPGNGGLVGQSFTKFRNR